uniref:Small nuclear ribonucleoprotein Sm D3 n=2 Tax=Laurasiatheria TaxID=314145 RepID=A0A8D1H6B1_PIG
MTWAARGSHGPGPAPAAASASSGAGAGPLVPGFLGRHRRCQRGGEKGRRLLGRPKPRPGPSRPWPAPSALGPAPARPRLLWPSSPQAPRLLSPLVPAAQSVSSQGCRPDLRGLARTRSPFPPRSPEAPPRPGSSTNAGSPEPPASSASARSYSSASLGAGRPSPTSTLFGGTAEGRHPLCSCLPLRSGVPLPGTAGFRRLNCEGRSWPSAPPTASPDPRLAVQPVAGVRCLEKRVPLCPCRPEGRCFRRHLGPVISLPGPELLNHRPSFPAGGVRWKRGRDRAHHWEKEEGGPCARHFGNAWYSGSAGPAIRLSHASQSAESRPHREGGGDLRRTCSGYCFGQLRSTSYVLKNSLPAEMSIGVPIKVLHEAEGHIVTCETNTGEVYRGKLIEAEDNMNCQMSNITVTYRDGRVAQLEQVYIRGSKIRFLILPDMLKNAPMLKSMKNKNQGSGAGRGKAAILKAQGRCSSCTGCDM